MSLTVVKKLTFKWKVGSQEVTDIEVRPSTMTDICDVETEVSVTKPNAFNIQMACLQVVKAGTFTGPFTPAHFKALRPSQFGEIADAMREADALGEA